MNIVAFFNQAMPALQSILFLVTLAGGVFLLNAQKRAGVVKIQSETIHAMQEQIDALKEQNTQQQQKLDRQEFELKAMRDALKDEGILITIDGEKVTIRDTREPGTSRHIIRKPKGSPPKKAPPPATTKKEETL